MFLEFISNLSEKLRNITCEIQELPSKSQKRYWKIQKVVGFDSMIFRLEVERANHCTALDLF